MRRNFGLQVMECGSIERNGSFDCAARTSVGEIPNSSRNNVTPPANTEDSVNLKT